MRTAARWIPPNSTALVVSVRVLPGSEDTPLPARATAGSAGFDLRAAEAVTLVPGAWAVVPTGIALAIPDGWEGQVRPRSGLAARHGVTVLNAPGTIDADYRGEIRVPLVNHGRDSPPPTSSAPSRSAPTSSCTPPRSTSSATPTWSAASS